MADTQVRAFAGGVTKAVGERQVRVVVSTPTVDRSGDIVEVAGIDLTAYRKNPVVLYQHDHDEPVARCAEIGLNGAALEALVQFPPEGTSAKSDEVYGLIKAGVINASSIGFLPKDFTYVDPKEPWNGRRFSSCEMLEFSFVSVPCNPEALIVERGLLAAEEQIKLARENLLRIKGETLPEPPEMPTGTPVNPAMKGEEGENVGPAFKAGDRVRVLGAPHMAGQSIGTIVEVSTDTPYAIRFDEMPGDLHKWYVSSELVPADDDAEKPSDGMDDMDGMKRAAEIRDLEIKAFEIAIG